MKITLALIALATAIVGLMAAVFHATGVTTVPFDQLTEVLTSLGELIQAGMDALQGLEE